MFSNSDFQFVYLVRLHGDACIWVIEKMCHLITTMNKQTEMNMTSSWETNLLSQHTQNHRSTDQCYVPSNAVICQEKKESRRPLACQFTYLLSSHFCCHLWMQINKANKWRNHSLTSWWFCDYISANPVYKVLFFGYRFLEFICTHSFLQSSEIKLLHIHDLLKMHINPQLKIVQEMHYFWVILASPISAFY